jgi:hypothetical protein
MRVPTNNQGGAKKLHIKNHTRTLEKHTYVCGCSKKWLERENDLQEVFALLEYLLVGADVATDDTS